MAERKGFNMLFLLPPVIFGALTFAFYMGLQREAPDALPSALVGQQAPPLDLAPLSPEIPADTQAALDAEGLKLVNFWASWCVPCRAEHPMLEKMANDGVAIIGANYKNRPADALAFLEELGNPFVASGGDESGRIGIEWGLYGVPETFVIDADGTVILRHAGPITASVYENVFVPVLGTD